MQEKICCRKDTTDVPPVPPVTPTPPPHLSLLPNSYLSASLNLWGNVLRVHTTGRWFWRRVGVEPNFLERPIVLHCWLLKCRWKWKGGVKVEVKQRLGVCCGDMRVFRRMNVYIDRFLVTSSWEEVSQGNSGFFPFYFGWLHFLIDDENTFTLRHKSLAIKFFNFFSEVHYTRQVKRGQYLKKIVKSQPKKLPS